MFSILFLVLMCISSNYIYGIELDVQPENKGNFAQYGALINPTGSPIGGGNGYTGIVDKGNYIVSNSESLLAALASAATGQIVYVEDDAEIDLSGYSGLTIQPGVILASGRGKNDSEGALLFSTELRTLPLFKVGGQDVRITGLRISGPDPERREEMLSTLSEKGRYYEHPVSRGLSSEYSNLEVDNCELWGWSHAAILLNGVSNAFIHHNYIHHNQRHGLGYGIVLQDANALIEANAFEWNRHSIAGTGSNDTSYEARYNLIKKNASSHAFDMHGGKDRADGTNVAGNIINIHHNTFLLDDHLAIKIRGIPLVKAEIFRNCFSVAQPDKAIQQINGKGKMIIYDNKYMGCE